MSTLDPPGTPCSIDELGTPLGRRLATAARQGLLDDATLVSFGKDGHLDVVVLDLEVEVPQRPVHDIRDTERVALVFAPDSTLNPDVLSLRSSFPIVPHLNVREEELPRSLCLYDRPFADLLARWTPTRFVRRIRDWLALTAKGLLHQPDQAVEPFFVGLAGDIILPSWTKDLSDPRWQKPLVLGRRSSEADHLVLLLDADGVGANSKVERVLSPHVLRAQEHGPIHRAPSNLAELIDLLSRTGLDLVSELRTRLLEWSDSQPKLLDRPIALALLTPMSRQAGGTVERVDVVGILVNATAAQLGTRLGIWETRAGIRGRLIPSAPPSGLGGVAVGFLNASFTPTPADLARYNGRAPVDLKVGCIGAGALGSQLIGNAVRAGFGQWSVIDDDWIRPHNVAKQRFSGLALGFGKAEAVVLEANALTGNAPRHRAIRADALEVDNAEVAGVLAQSDLVVDLSASVRVSRSLAANTTVRRAVSAFLSPSGRDLVVLREDDQRQVRLDALEMIYLSGVHRLDSLASHLALPEKMRYAQGCRDVSSTIRQDHVAVLAGIASATIQEQQSCPSALVAIWQLQPDYSVVRTELPVLQSHLLNIGAWRLQLSEAAIQQMRAARRSRLPRETGGVLVGVFDFEQSTIHVTDALDAPADSNELNYGFVRGYAGLKSRLDSIERRTMGQLEYVGEWHSHPEGVSTLPSTDDQVLLTWVASHVAREGTPAVMIISGDEDCRVLIGDHQGDGVIEEGRL